MNEPPARVEADAEVPDFPRRSLERRRIVIRDGGDVEGRALHVFGAGRAADGAVAGQAEMLDLNALTAIGVETVGRLMDVRDGAAQFSGALANHA